MSAAVRAGYKQTEVGVIPEDWEVRSVCEIGEIKTGPFGTLLKANEYAGINGVPLISVGEVGYGDFRVSEHTPLVPDAVVKRLPQYVLRSGDIVFGRKGAVDRSALVSEKEDGWFLGSDGMSVRPSKICHAPFLACQFQRHEVQSWLLQNASGTTMASLNQEILSKVTIPYAPLSEQRAIATALSDVDALLSKLEALIAKKRDLKQAAMQQLLTGQTRLPGFSGEWEVKQMKSLGATYGGLTGKTKIDFGHGKARYIPFMNVMTDTVIDSAWLEAVDISSNEAQNLTQKGDLFFNGSSETPEEVGFCSVLLQDIPNLYLNSFCFGFRFNPDAQTHGLFFAYWFRSLAGRQAMSVLAQGATRYNIAKSAFLKLELPQPTLAEQTAIATVLSDMDAALSALEARRDKTRALKQGMMQELLTGRIRLV